MTYYPPDLHPLPLAPALELFGTRFASERRGGQVPSCAEWLGRSVGSETKSAARKRGVRLLASGSLTVWEADAIATALGVHPSALWGEAWGEARSLRDDPLDAIFAGLWCVAGA